MRRDRFEIFHFDFEFEDFFAEKTDNLAEKRRVGRRDRCLQRSEWRKVHSTRGSAIYCHGVV
jgi:hypothetical protein